MSGKPVIGIAQSGSDLAPCNRYHLELAKRVREGIRSAGAIAFEFPTHPIQESSRRPTAAIDRNLAYIALVEVLHGYPLDGVVLLTGCDKTTPAMIMAASTVVSDIYIYIFCVIYFLSALLLIHICFKNIPAICLNVGPMLNGYLEHQLAGSGMVLWRGRELYATGEVDKEGLIDYISRGYV